MTRAEYQRLRKLEAAERHLAIAAELLYEAGEVAAGHDCIHINGDVVHREIRKLREKRKDKI